MHEQAAPWDARYRKQASEAPQPCPLLAAYAHLLPTQGRALDLACGRGGNALLLAAHGLETHAWDYSAVALGQLEGWAQQRGLVLHTQCRDVIAQPPLASSYDVIVVSRFLHRPLCPSLGQALRPGGLLFYQTFLQQRRDPHVGPHNPDFLLQEGELLRLFGGLRLRLYREEGLVGELHHGERNEAWLIAQAASPSPPVGEKG